MFQKNTKTTTQTATTFVKKNSPPSIVSSDLMIKGDLFAEGELHVDGKVEGDVKCRSIIIGIDGCIIGSVSADSAKVYGLLTGELAVKTVLLGATARVRGDITHESLAIEPGAFLDGHCRRVNDPIAAEAGPSDLMITDARKQNKPTTAPALEGNKDNNSNEKKTN